MTTALAALSAASVMTAGASSASVCQPNGTGCTKAGTYPGLNARINSDYGGARIIWTSSKVTPYSSGVPLSWTAYVVYTDVSSGSIELTCANGGIGQPYEVMSGGSGDDGEVSASTDTCTANPNLTVTLNPGQSYTNFATFDNVPWPGSTVALQWGSGGTSPSVYPFISGEACVFDAPTGVTAVAGKKFIGHVGWGFELPSGNWEFGANEGPGNLDISHTWYATGSQKQMLAAFRNQGHYHKAGFYTQYRCAAVKTTSTGVSHAGTTVNKEFNELYAIPGQDCESQAYSVLAAYGVTKLPSDTSLSYWPSPNNWFNHLTQAGFGRTRRP
jgi:hypothetical protein